MKRPAEVLEHLDWPNPRHRSRPCLELRILYFPEIASQNVTYEAIATVMQECRVHIRCDGVEQMECVVKYLADLFAGDNGEFKRDRFVRACELGANVRARS